MFCEYCGNRIDDLHKFCTKCGRATSTNKDKEIISEDKTHVSLEEKWWQRLLKVVYILLYFPLLVIVPLVWSENSSSYSGYYAGQYRYEDTYAEAFWYSLLTLIIYLIVLRMIKLATLYITIGQKPNWKKEFKKLF